MIVTRQRKEKKNSLPILLPIAAIAMVVVALTWPPSRNFITNGPAHPVFVVLGNVWGTVSQPLTFAYQQQQLTERNVEIKSLSDKLEADRKASDDKDSQIQALQKQIAAAQAQPEATDTSSPAPGAAAAAAPSVNGAVPGTGQPAESPAMAALKLTAGQWTAMDPARAAALAQKLSPAYDATVFAQMTPDNVGPIMDALPPAFAAQIVQAGGGQAQISAQPADK